MHKGVNQIINDILEGVRQYVTFLLLETLFLEVKFLFESKIRLYKVLYYFFILDFQAYKS
jgi:hypothetical protein